VDGVDLSGDVGSLGSIHGGPAVLDVTGINQLAYNRIGGERDGGIDFAAWFNSAAGQEHPTLSTLPTTDRIVTYLHGSTLGNDGAAMVAKQVNYDMTRGTDGALSLAVSAVANGFGLEWGNQVTPGKRSDTTATSPATGFDFTTVSTSFGWQAYLHVFSFTGTSVTVTLQDSADNSAFAGFTGSAFVAASAVGAQRIAGAAGSTVRRYVRVITTGTFSQATFSVLLVKNQNVQVVF
jgi:hypothetical protein